MKGTRKMKPTLKEIHDRFDEIARNTPQTEEELVRLLMEVNGMSESEVRARASDTLTSFGRLVFKAFPDNKHYFTLTFTTGVKKGVAPESPYGGIPSLRSIHTLYNRLRREARSKKASARKSLFVEVEEWLALNEAGIEYSLGSTGEGSWKIEVRGEPASEVRALCSRVEHGVGRGIFNSMGNMIYFMESGGVKRAEEERTLEEAEEEALEEVVEGLPELPTPPPELKRAMKAEWGSKQLASGGKYHTWTPRKKRIIRDSVDVVRKGSSEEKGEFLRGLLDGLKPSKDESQLDIFLKNVGRGQVRTRPQTSGEFYYSLGKSFSFLCISAGLVFLLYFIFLYVTGNAFAVGLISIINSILIGSVRTAYQSPVYLFIYLLAMNAILRREAIKDFLGSILRTANTSVLAFGTYLGDKYNALKKGTIARLNRIYQSVKQKFRRASHSY